METGDGSRTLVSGVFGETYHSLRGAVGESRHVFIDAGFNYESGTGTDARPSALPCHPEASECEARDLPVRVFEVGFGSGLNAWLTLLEAEKSGRTVEYVGVEKYPVAPATARGLGYTTDPRFAALHTAPWGEWTQISPRFRLLKLRADLTEILEGPVRGFGGRAGRDSRSEDKFDAVYYDAFAPDVQPELWTPELFGRIFETMSAGGVLVTYSAKGDVRRALQNAGFAVEKLPGALGKRHMLRAKK